MRDVEQLSQLIGVIYDAALDPALWPEALERYAGFVGGAASALFMKDSVRKTHNNVFIWGYDPDYTRVYLEKYVQLDPFTTGQFFFDVEEPMCLADIMPRDEFHKSRFYEEWVRPQRWVDALGVTLEKSLTTYASLSLIRHETHGVVDDEAKRRAKLIAPHVRRAVLIGKVVDLHKVEAAVLADTLDGLAAAMFLVDAAGRILHANAAAHVMLAEGKVLRAIAGKLAAADAQGDRALHDVFMSADAGDAAVGVKGAAVPLSAPDTDRYVAHVLPLTAGARRKAAVAYSAVAAVFVRKAALDLPHPLETIVKTFKLTPAELRVLTMIVEIGGVPEVARALGLSEPTVKTHLQHIFHKTGTTRQADLVKLVASYLSPLAT
jgi:DNA-binding CsgD family transcriptional regulator